MNEQSPGAGAMDVVAILKALPHRYPFLLVDRVVSVEPGVRIHAYKNVTINEPFFAGHFPERPVMPGVLIVEALAQAGGLLALATESFDPAKQLMFFLGIDKCRFRIPVGPGDRLDCNVNVTHRRQNVWKLHGEARVDGRIAAQADLMAAVVDRAEGTLSAP